MPVGGQEGEMMGLRWQVGVNVWWVINIDFERKMEWSLEIVSFDDVTTVRVDS